MFLADSAKNYLRTHALAIKIGCVLNPTDPIFNVVQKDYQFLKVNKIMCFFQVRSLVISLLAHLRYLQQKLNFRIEIIKVESCVLLRELTRIK